MTVTILFGTKVTSIKVKGLVAIFLGYLLLWGESMPSISASFVQCDIAFHTST